MNTFSTTRLVKLIKNDIVLHKKVITISAVSVMIFLAIFPFITFNAFTYSLILFGGGLIITSKVFNELYDANQSPLYLMLPCSNLERFLSKWFLTSIGYAGATLILYFLFSIVVSTLNLFIFKHPFNMFQPAIYNMVGDYIVIQSIFFLGSIVFKQYSFIKTCFVLCVLSSIAFIATFIFATHLNHDFLSFIESHKLEFNIYLPYAIKIAWYSIAIICAYFTYQLLNKYELK